VQLGLLPRVTVRHTSRSAEGQIYLPEVNWLLCVLCIALVLAFRESSALAAAFGIAVSGTMAITSYVFFVVARRTWGWPLWKALPPVIVFSIVDLAFFAANLPKFFQGGWVPILVGSLMFAVMADWRRGRAVLAERIAQVSPPLDAFVAELEAHCQARVPGTSIFLASSPTGTPPVLFQHARRLRVLSENVGVLTVVTEHVPYSVDRGRVTVEDLGKGVRRIVVRTGFMERPNVPRLLAAAVLPFDMGDPTYFIGREAFVAGRSGEMGVVSESLFAFLTRNAKSATAWFGIPPEQVVELGMQMDL
jgi:KUP system potassium uptake protein